MFPLQTLEEAVECEKGERVMVQHVGFAATGYEVIYRIYYASGMVSRHKSTVVSCGLNDAETVIRTFLRDGRRSLADAGIERVEWESKIRIKRGVIHTETLEIPKEN